MAVVHEASSALALVAAYAVAWLIFSPETFGWAAVATLEGMRAATHPKDYCYVKDWGER